MSLLGHSWARFFHGQSQVAQIVQMREETNKMKVTVPHHTTRSKARKKVDRLLVELQESMSHMITDLDQYWEDDLLVFDFKAKGLKARGTLEVTDDEIILDGRLPLLAKPFESRIKSEIEREARSMFRRA